MESGALFALAVGLSMDATAVAAARGLASPELRPRHFVQVAVLFGGAQAAMPLLGYLLGARLGPFLAAWTHWIASSLLFGIGAKMLWETRGGDEPEEEAVGDPFAMGTMLGLALATSIDAFAAGITLPMLKAPLVLSLATIGVTTAALSALGLAAGRRFGALFGKKLDALGGLVLVGLAVKVLAGHYLGG